MKNNFDRRNLLKGLLTLPAAAAAGAWISSCGKKSSDSTPNQQAKTSTLAKGSATKTTVNFNVVLHGTYALQFDTLNKQVLILIPSVFEADGTTPAHEYRAGTFRQEGKIDASPGTVLTFG